MGSSENDDVDDAALVARCLQDDEAAWRMLVTRYRSLVYSAALRAGLDDESSADAFQQVWIELHRSLDRLRDPQSLPKWLVVTTRRIAFKVARKYDRPLEGDFDQLIDPAALPSESLASLQRLQHLQAHVDALGGTCAKLLHLLFLDDRQLDYREISAEAEVAVGSIGPLRARCLKRLRQRLEVES